MKLGHVAAKLAFAGLLVVVVSSTPSCSSCSESTSNVRDLANALGDEFTGLLEFQDGVLVDGLPPGSDPDGPQLSALTAPLLAGAEERLSDGTVVGSDYEQWFDVLLRSRDTVEELQYVTGAIAFVQQANKDDSADSFIRVEQDMPFVEDGSERVFTLFARVHRLAQLQQGLTSGLRSDLQMRDVPEGMVATDGNAYHVYIALFSRLPDGTEKVGNYVIWNLSTYPGEFGDNIIDMCVARAAFADGQLLETNLEARAGCPAYIREAFGARPSEVSPCGVWSEVAAGHNTLRDAIEVVAADPDYEELNTVMYPVGTRFFTFADPIERVPVDHPDCWVELTWCPRDEPTCTTQADCRTADHLCCDGLCRDSQISDNFCGQCEIQCGDADECLAGVCGLQPDCFVDADCPIPDAICCDGVCYDSMTDDSHCGTCDIQCTGNDTCVAGDCGSTPQCTQEIVLAAWTFDDNSPQPSETAPNVIAWDFTCHDGNPYIDPSPVGAGSWIAELGWNNPLNYLAGYIDPQAGYELQLVSVTFEEATESLAEGPSSFSLRSSVDGYIADLPPTPMPTAEIPNLQAHVVDLSQLIPEPGARFRIHWYAFGAADSQIKWGLDNVVIRGRVCPP